MDPIGLQEALVGELRMIFDDLYLEDPRGGKKKLSVFAQDLPVEQHIAGNEAGQNPFPFITVRLLSGEIPEGRNADHLMRTELIIGIFDSGRVQQGVGTVVDIIQEIYRRFAEMPLLGRRYVLQFPVGWQLMESETRDHKYHFGSMGLTWRAPAIERRLPYI